MKIFIPPLGTRMILNRDWHFLLLDDHKNDVMIKILKAAPAARIHDQRKSWPAMLPAGTELTIRTIDIRQAQNGFENIAFTAKINGRAHRFFVRLACANRIDAHLLDQS